MKISPLAGSAFGPQIGVGPPWNQGNSRRGASAIEYAAALSLVVVAAIGGIQYLGSATSGAYASAGAGAKSNQTTASSSTKPTTSTTTTSATTPAESVSTPLLEEPTTTPDADSTTTKPGKKKKKS